MAWTSRKRIAQAKLWFALGKVTGFHGWINALEQSIKDAGVETPETRAMHIVLNVVRKQLRKVEEEIREQMRNIK